MITDLHRRVNCGPIQNWVDLDILKSDMGVYQDCSAQDGVHYGVQ